MLFLTEVRSGGSPHQVSTFCLLQRIPERLLDPCWYETPPARRSALLFHVSTPSVLFKYNGRSGGGGGGGSGNTRGGVMIRKRRPNWIDAPDDSFFLVTRETR